MTFKEVYDNLPEDNKSFRLFLYGDEVLEHYLQEDGEYIDIYDDIPLKGCLKTFGNLKCETEDNEYCIDGNTYVSCKHIYIGSSFLNY